MYRELASVGIKRGSELTVETFNKWIQKADTKNHRYMCDKLLQYLIFKGEFPKAQAGVGDIERTRYQGARLMFIYSQLLIIWLFIT